MIKHISFIKRHANVSREEFRRYWEEVHAPLVREALPTLRKYVGNFTHEALPLRPRHPSAMAHGRGFGVGPA